MRRTSWFLPACSLWLWTLFERSQASELSVRLAPVAFHFLVKCDHGVSATAAIPDHRSQVSVRDPGNSFRVAMPITAEC